MHANEGGYNAYYLLHLQLLSVLFAMYLHDQWAYLLGTYFNVIQLFTF